MDGTATPLDLLHSYLRRSWALVPLHDVSAGSCSCRAGAQCGSAGKHPRYARWEQDGQLIRDAATLEALYHAHPEWNWGVATGAPSGMWVLDWDVDHDAEILRWCAEQGAPHWKPSTVVEFGTLTLGPTGGGGRHYVFELPPWGEPRGSQTRNRYGLPPGLDVRGWHGQIVVAPSVSGKGPYGATLIDAPIRRAPAWLEEMIRPQPDTQPVDRPPTTAPTDISGQDRTAPDTRALAYARAAVSGALAELNEAPEGTRNDTAFRVACRLHELANAPWSGFTEEALLQYWWQSRWWHEVGRDSADGVWRRAGRQVGGAAAVLPPDYAGAEHIPILDFPAPGAAPVSGGHPAAGLQLEDPGASAPVDHAQLLIDKMLTPEQLAELPPPQPLVNGLLDLDTCAWIIGRPGCGKSFVTLDLAAHVGLGIPWQGRGVHQGLVVIMVAEGARGIRLRADAWRREYGHMKDVLFLPIAVPVNERTGRYGASVAGAWSAFTEACRRLQPVMVVIDTQARVTAGLNENDSGDMGYYVEQVDRIRQATGACVLSVHHQGRTGANARGSSAIDGAQDTELRMERADRAMVATLHIDKQKDQAEVKPLELALQLSAGGVGPDGRDLSSLVLARMPEPGLFQDPIELPEMIEATIGQRRAVLLYQTIYDRFNAGDGGTKAEIKQAFMDHREIASLTVPARRKAWLRAWGGTDAQPGLVPLGLIAQRAGAARFKVIVLSDQSAAGVLTPNDGPNPTLPPEGWNQYLPDESPRN